jgi:Domain of unknown function (DUF3806)
MMGCANKGSPTLPASKFCELSSEERARLDKQRGVVAAEAKKRYGTPALTRTSMDLGILQSLLDDHAFSKSQTYELQCLGVVFGDVLASMLPVRWVIVTDEFGTDPTLRLKDTTIQLNALTMIAKRVEDGVAVDVSDLLSASEKIIADMEKDAEKEAAQK